MTIKIFTTGGSIDKLYSTKFSDFIVGDPQIGFILQDANVTTPYEIESVFRKDSLAISDEDREYLVERVQATPHEQIVITHGTDTLINTAIALLPIEGKTIVLTGALQPAAFKYSDAVFNIGFAMAAVQILAEGVYVVMNGQIFDPRYVRKNTDLDQFEYVP